MLRREAMYHPLMPVKLPLKLRGALRCGAILSSINCH